MGTDLIKSGSHDFRVLIKCIAVMITSSQIETLVVPYFKGTDGIKAIQNI